jgi:isopenicillin N synthase-like dioxygenase
MTDFIPTLDAGSTEDPKFARDLSAAYEEYGFVIIQNHGIDKRVIDSAWPAFSASSRCRTRKSAATRCRAAAAHAAIPLRHRNRQGRQHHDLKEFWHVGRELPPGHPIRQGHGA